MQSKQWSHPSIWLDRRMLWALFWINLLGTAYGYYWYRYQLLDTPWYLLPFVPDSPTASLFFTWFLWLIVHHRHHPWIEAFAAVTMMKYGLWAVAVILATGFLRDPFYVHPLNWMLVFSHLGMAAEALLYARFYRFDARHLLLVAMWVLSNDFLDYILDIHPWVEPPLEPYQTPLALFTLGLSLLCLLTFWYLSRRYAERVEQA